MVLAALMGVALAGVRFERPPAKVEEGALDAAPLTTSTAEHRAWRERMSTRGGYAVMDAVLRWRADDIDACVRTGGATADLTARVDVAVSTDGTTTVKAKDGDLTLAGCVASVVGGLTSAPLRRDVKGTYTVSWTAAADAAPTTPAADPLAFAPKVDDEGGFGAIPFGAPASVDESMMAVGSQKSTTFYQRQADYLVKWFGASLFGASYAFGEDGFYAVTVGVVGTTTAWRLREALTARYGPPRWDNRFGAYYWRGERLLLQYRPVPASEEVTITLLDIGRARTSGLAESLPGDPVDPLETDADRRLPRIFQDK